MKKPMKLKDLIGYELVGIVDNKVLIANGKKHYTLLIVDNYGDCCGYNEIKTTFDNSVNPVITGVTSEQQDDDCGEFETGKITFYGLNKAIATIETKSSSGSGWQYGACVTLRCTALNLDEVISEW